MQALRTLLPVVPDTRAVHQAGIGRIANYIRANLPGSLGQSALLARSLDKVISPHMLACRFRDWAVETKSAIITDGGMVRVTLNHRSTRIAGVKGDKFELELEDCWKAFSGIFDGCYGLVLPHTTGKVLAEFANGLSPRVVRLRPVEFGAGGYGVGNSFTN